MDTPVAELDLPALRAERDELREREAGLSYTRRILQAQLDIVRAHVDGEGGPFDIAAILGEEPGTGGGETRAVLVSAPADVTVPGLPDLESLDGDALTALASDLQEREQGVSEERRTVLDRLDALQDEVVRRYRDEGVDVADVIGGGG